MAARLRHELSPPARTLDHEFESHSRYGWLHAFAVCVVLCVGRGLATGWSPVQGVPPTVLELENREKKTNAPQKAYRVIIGTCVIWKATVFRFYET
jgi:hypothetical protein